ncbi:CASP-like protein 1C1 [Euphorbia lathyris]|uniref:CASP-like protein 1C1 n=1 Tax=Euphorbia lathyris TaxID=212925 RepID=UPI003313B9F1
MELISKCKAKKICLILLRMIAFGSTVAAAVVMATSHQTVAVAPGVSVQVKFSDAPALKYFVIAQSLVSVYGFLVLFVPSEGLLRRSILASDMVFIMLLSSSISAALAVSEVGKKGNPLAGWRPICGMVPKYCDQVRAALIVGFIGLFSYTITLITSICTILSPPPLPKT